MGRISKVAAKSIAEALERGKACPHPPDKRETIGYGIYCQLCKCRMGFISDTQAQKAMTDAIKSMYGK